MTARRSGRWRAWPYYLLTIGLLVLIGLVVTQYAPRFTADLAQITIGTTPDYVEVPGQTLTCAPREPGIWADCRVDFEGEQLHVVIHGSASDLSSCRATYAGATVGCVPGFIYTPASKPAVHITDTLGVPPARLAELRQRNPWSHLNDAQWSLIVIGVSATLAGLSTRVLREARRTWPGSALIGMGAGLFLVLFLTMEIGLLSVGFID